MLQTGTVGSRQLALLINFFAAVLSNQYSKQILQLRHHQQPSGITKQRRTIGAGQAFKTSPSGASHSNRKNYAVWHSCCSCLLAKWLADAAATVHQALTCQRDDPTG